MNNSLIQTFEPAAKQAVREADASPYANCRPKGSGALAWPRPIRLSWRTLPQALRHRPHRPDRHRRQLLCPAYRPQLPRPRLHGDGRGARPLWQLPGAVPGLGLRPLFGALRQHLHLRQLLELFREATAEDRGEEPWPVLVWKKKAASTTECARASSRRASAAPEEVVEQRRDHLARVRQALRRDAGLRLHHGPDRGLDRHCLGPDAADLPGHHRRDLRPGAVHTFQNFSLHARSSTTTAPSGRSSPAFNPGVRHLVTVSPVPLTGHGERAPCPLATVDLKKVVRAVAGQLEPNYHDRRLLPLLRDHRRPSVARLLLRRATCARSAPQGWRR